ncbi:unnamed protein product [Ixodes pacificus]
MELPLGDVVSPQFAFPIVGVIVCALLVFAFGFKSPSLPPSFVDEEEIQRADAKKLAAKKKKQAKEAQKNKPQSNGHAPTVSPKAVPAPAKPKALEKAAAPVKQKTEKVDAKSQPSKKVTQPEKRPAAKGKKAGEKEKAPAEATAPLTAEESSDGWVQLLSKKERKVRRKEEEKVVVPIVESTCRAIPAAESSKSSPGSKKKGGKKAAASAETPAPAAPVPEPKESAPVVVAADPEENPKDQRNKKKDKSPPEPEPVKNAKKETAKKCAVTPEDSGPAAAKSKGKGKAEKRPAEEVKAVPSKATPDTCSAPSGQTVLLAEPKRTEACSPDPTPQGSNDSTPGAGSNVAFDELGDAWQEAKPQKKKKKARKD